MRIAIILLASVSAVAQSPVTTPWWPNPNPFVQNPPIATPTLPPVCDASLWAHVYPGRFPTAQDRLKVITPCVRVTGLFSSATKEKDGDWHLRLMPDKPYLNFINSLNQSGEHGALVVEPICENPVTQLDALKQNTCAGYVGHLYSPSMLHKHVVVVGAYVTDMDHGWQEIHPASSIEVGQ